MKKYQLNLNRIENLTLSNNVALPWLERHKNSEQKMLIYVVETQIQIWFYKLLLGSKNTTCSVTRNNGGLSRKDSL